MLHLEDRGSRYVVSCTEFDIQLSRVADRIGIFVTQLATDKVVATHEITALQVRNTRLSHGMFGIDAGSVDAGV